MGLVKDVGIMEVEYLIWLMMVIVHELVSGGPVFYGGNCCGVFQNVVVGVTLEVECRRMLSK
ncbi:MAG: hypothetical protein QW514_10400 [Thermoprotei archaeon]